VDGISLWKEAGYRAKPTAWISGIEKEVGILRSEIE